MVRIGLALVLLLFCNASVSPVEAAGGVEDTSPVSITTPIEFCPSILEIGREKYGRGTHYKCWENRSRIGARR